MRHHSLGDLTRDAVRLMPEQPAVIQGDVVITYGELETRMNRFANCLVGLGLRQGDRVAFFYGNEARFIELFFGAMRAGAVAVPLNIRLTDDTLRYILDHAEVRAIVISEALGERGAALVEVQGGGDIVIFEGQPSARGHHLKTLLSRASDAHPTVPIHPDDLCMMPFTSGSTGRPKGVLLTHGGQLWNADAMRKTLMIDETERALVAVPLYHKNAMAGAVKPFLLGGGTLVILPAFDSETVIRAIDVYRCTYLPGVPAMFKLLVAQADLVARHDVSSLRWAVCGSATVPEQTLHLFEQQFGAPIGEGYGLTEGGPVVAETPRWGIRKYGSTGLPLPGCQVRLLDSASGARDVDIGEVGELVVRNPGIARGYYKLPDLTAQRFTADGWLYTGDLARRDEDGYLYISGRKDDMINVGGEHVYPKVVEDLLQRHPAIADVAVVSAPHPVKGEAPVAFVVLKPGAKLSEEEVKAFALAHGPAFAHPRRVYFLEHLPLSGTGKVDKVALRARVEALEAFGGG